MYTNILCHAPIKVSLTGNNSPTRYSLHPIHVLFLPSACFITVYINNVLRFTQSFNEFVSPILLIITVSHCPGTVLTIMCNQTALEVSTVEFCPMHTYGLLANIYVN